LLSKGKTKQAHAHENIGQVEDTLRKASLSPSVFSGMQFCRCSARVTISRQDALFYVFF
jgi:hypothetical protein